MPTPKTILTPEREALLPGLLSLRPWTGLWHSRRLILSLTQRRLQERFRGSILGAVWVFLLPILMLAIYAFAFVIVLQVGGGDTSTEQKIEITFSLFCGLILYSVFSETASRSASCIVGQPQFVKKVVFPLDALPVVACGESLVLTGASIAVLLLGVLLGLHRIYLAWLLLPLPLLLTAVLSIGLGWLLAAIGVFVRDLGQVLTVLLQMLFFLTPICYRLQDLPPWVQPWMQWNPLVPIVEAMRGIVLRGELPQPAGLVYVAVLGLGCAQLGHAAFALMRRRFADVL